MSYEAHPATTKQHRQQLGVLILFVIIYLFVCPLNAATQPQFSKLILKSSRTPVLVLIYFATLPLIHFIPMLFFMYIRTFDVPHM